MLQSIEIELASLFMLMIIDTAIGTVISLKDGSFSIGKFFKGFWKIVIYALLVGSAILVDFIMLSIYDGFYITIGIILSLSILELYTIFGKLSNTGVPIPDINNLIYYIGKGKKVSQNNSKVLRNLNIDKDLNLLLHKYINNIRNENKKRFLTVVFNSYKKFIINRIISDLTGMDNEIMKVKLNLFCKEALQNIQLVISRDTNLNVYFGTVVNISFNFENIVNKNIPVIKKKDLLVERVVEKMYEIFNKVN